MERRLPQRFEHLPHGLTDHPVDHVGNPQSALPASRLGYVGPANLAGPIRTGQQVGLQPGQHDRPLLYQLLDRLPVRARERPCSTPPSPTHPSIDTRPPRSSPALHSPALPIACGAPARIGPKPVPGLPAGGPLRVFCCCDRQAELHRRFFDRDRLPLPAGARPGALSGHYPAFRYYAVLGLLLGHRPSSSRSPTYRQSPEPSRPPGVKR